MALPEINTGYRPEFGLGALYQGFNAGNASTGAELELIKQFLANQRSQEMNPLDAERKRQEISMDQYKTDPTYQGNMQRIQQGQADSQTAAGELAQGLLPFRKQTGQMELENKQGEFRNLAQIQAIDDMLGDTKAKWANPQSQKDALRLRANLINRFKDTPTFAGKRELGETRTDSAEYIAELKAQHAAELARLRGEKQSLPTIDQAAVQDVYRRLADGKITREQATMEIADLFNTKVAAKIQPGNIVNPEVAPGVLQPKPPQKTYTPNSATPSLPSGWTLKK